MQGETPHAQYPMGIPGKYPQNTYWWGFRSSMAPVILNIPGKEGDKEGLSLLAGSHAHVKTMVAAGTRIVLRAMRV